MPRYKLGARVTGPYYCEARSKWRIFVYDGPKPIVLWFATENDARKGMRDAAQTLSTSERRLLGALIAQYYAEKQQRGIATASTCAHQIVRLRGFFAPYLDQDISRITPRRAASLYEQHTVALCPRSRRPPAAASHHLDLYITRCFFKWAVRKHYIDQNPFHEVQPIGRASTGKPQLRLDEAKRYREAALRLFDQNHDRFALAAVIPLYLGMRAGEVLSRRVRDVDADGRILWIDRGKSKNARRHLSVKAEPLRTRLAQLAGGRHPEEPLFAVSGVARAPVPQSLRRAVRRVCKAAGVPIVCPHSLRGLWATLSLEAGAAESAVATALGHGSFEMTAKHYAQPEAVVGARSARVLDLLDDVLGAQPISGLSAEQLAHCLPPETLAELRKLLTDTPARPVDNSHRSVEP